MRSLMLCSLLLLTFFVNAQNSFQVSFNLKFVKNTKLNFNVIDITILNYENLPFESKDGVIRFKGLTKGTYQAIISGEGIASKLISFNVANNTEINIELQPLYTSLGDITVNANKRELNLLTFPGAVTSLQTKQIKDMRIWEMSDLSGLAPNFYLANSGDNRNITSIRGITTTSYEQAVVTYIDGVAQFNLDTYIPQLQNIDHIEIIRGAQGTFYGRNAMGGIINITTKKPVNKITGYVDNQIGNFGQQRYSGGLNIPLAKDKAFFGLSVLHDKKNGFYTNTVFNQPYDKQTQTMIDAQLRIYLKNNWSILANHKQYFGRNKGAFPLVNDLTSLFQEPYKLAQNQLAKMIDNSSNTSISIKHKGNGFDLTLQSAYQRNYRFYDNTLDADFSPADIVGIFNNYGKDFNTVSIFSNELRLQSSSSKQNSKLDWTAGLYQFTQTNPGRQANVFGNDAGFIGVPDINFALISNNNSTNNGLAAYASLGYKLSNKFTLSGGIRVDNEHRSMTVSSEYEKEPNRPFVTFEPQSAKTNYTAFSPKLALQYQAAENNHFYLTYARGFRSGGLSGISSDPSQKPLASYLPEYSNMFEIGTKGMNKKQTIRYTTAIFYNLVTNIQTPLLILPDAITITQNAGKLRSLGIEFELNAQITKGITVQYSGGLTDAKYQTLDAVSDGNQVNLSGNRQVFTPSSNHLIGLQYQAKIGKNDFSIRTDFIQTGTQYFDLANTIKQDSYGVLNMRTSYKIKSLEFSLWARNIGATKYIAYAYDFGAAHLGRPRTVGIGLNYRIN